MILKIKKPNISNLINHKYIKRILITLFIQSYKHVKGNKKVYISYIPEPFFKSGDVKYFAGHQNRKETLIIGDVFKQFNFKFIVERFDKYFPKRDNYEIIFGIGINFCKMATNCSSSLKIYYATGAYFDHQNSMVINRTDTFNKLNKTNLSYQRLANENNACDIADYIFQIGTKFTLETYPKKYLEKIILIDQSSEDFDDFSIEDKLKIIDKTKFIWFGSGGSILKGLDLLINYFKNNPYLELNIVGNIDYDFELVVKEEILKSSNIIYHGYKFIHDPLFYAIVKQCTFVIFPSGSEGGCPGSVINLMKMGIIPIVSRWAAVDQINELGILIESLQPDGIRDAINKSQSLSKEMIIELATKNSNYAKEKYNINQFKLQFSNALESCMVNIPFIKKNNN
jgi:hypothetical protein